MLKMSSSNSGCYGKITRLRNGKGCKQSSEVYLPQHAVLKDSEVEEAKKGYCPKNAQ